MVSNFPPRMARGVSVVDVVVVSILLVCCTDLFISSTSALTGKRQRGTRILMMRPSLSLSRSSSSSPPSPSLLRNHQINRSSSNHNNVNSLKVGGRYRQIQRQSLSSSSLRSFSSSQNESLWLRIENVRSSEWVEQVLASLSSLDKNDKYIQLPVKCFDELPPNQHVEGRTHDPTFSRFSKGHPGFYVDPKKLLDRVDLQLRQQPVVNGENVQESDGGSARNASEESRDSNATQFLAALKPLSPLAVSPETRGAILEAPKIQRKVEIWKVGYRKIQERTTTRSFTTSSFISAAAAATTTSLHAVSPTSPDTDNPVVTYQGADQKPRMPLTEKQKQAWLQKLEEMKKYQDKNDGSSFPPLGSPLRYWASLQRTNFNKERMNPYRIELLNSINFQWSKPSGAPKLDWNMMYDRLVEYKQRHGDTKVPQHYPKDPQLGTWCYKQKELSQKGTLDSERKAKLDGIGFVFDEIVSAEERWDDKYNRLVEYWKKHNSTIVPNEYENDPKLGTWVMHQRAFYDKKGKLSPERIDRLEAIGFVWDAQEAAWQEMYNRLIEYKEEKGNADVPKLYDEDRKLGNWVNSQRKAYQKGKLSPDRIEKLESIGFRWKTRASPGEKC